MQHHLNELRDATVVEFDSLEAFAVHFYRLAAGTREHLERGLELAIEEVYITAVDEIGTYQEAADPFPAWATLADSTLHGWESPWGQVFPGKIELGYATEGQHNPLLRTGEMRASLEWSRDGLTAAVGSDSWIMLYQEMGTPTIPARSVLGMAMVRCESFIEMAMANAAIKAIVPGMKGWPP